MTPNWLEIAKHGDLTDADLQAEVQSLRVDEAAAKFLAVLEQLKRRLGELGDE